MKYIIFTNTKIDECQTLNKALKNLNEFKFRMKK